MKRRFNSLDDLVRLVQKEVVARGREELGLPVRRKRRRPGLSPIQTTLVEARVTYYDGRDEDRVRMNLHCDDTMRISGWPHAPLGVKRPRAKSFALTDLESQIYEYKLSQIQGLEPGKGHRSGEDYGELREAVTVVLKGTSCDGRYSWDNGAPGKWRKLDDLVMDLVFKFQDLCAADEESERHLRRRV